MSDVMKIRTRYRRWRTGRALYDTAVASVTRADNAEAEGRSRAYSTIRAIHAEHPRPGRNCSVPNCCEVVD